MILLTGATGQLGNATIDFLFKKVPSNQISALVPANTPTIQPDPNENLLLNELMSQVNNAIVNNNSIINNRSSSEDVYSESPRIRDNNTSIQRSSLQNTSPWDIPFSFAR